MPNRKKKPAPTTARFCDQCGERILRAATDTGHVALNPTTNPAGGYLAYPGTSTWRARVNVVSTSLHPLEKPYQVHAATCSPPATTEPNETESS